MYPLASPSAAARQSTAPSLPSSATHLVDHVDEGADVVVLEGHENFDREFRGEVLQPSTAHLLDELGLLQYVLDRPHSLLDAGRVAVVIVAGGQGTRLGFDGPKGTYPIGPVSKASLFQIHAEKIVALSRRHGALVPLYIMTSPENHRATQEFFR